MVKRTKTWKDVDPERQLLFREMAKADFPVKTISKLLHFQANAVRDWLDATEPGWKRQAQPKPLIEHGLSRIRDKKAKKFGDAKGFMIPSIFFDVQMACPPVENETNAPEPLPRPGQEVLLPE